MAIVAAAGFDGLEGIGRKGILDAFLEGQGEGFALGGAAGQVFPANGVPDGFHLVVDRIGKLCYISFKFKKGV